MPAVKILTFLIIVVMLWLPKNVSAQTPARQAPAAPVGAPANAPRSAQAPTRPAPTPIPTAPTAPADAARAAPVSAEPEATTATYGDWLLRCQKIAAADSAQRVCEVVQTVQAQGQQNPILQLSIGAPGAKDPMKLTIVAPLNVSFPSVARLAVDEKDPQPTELIWRRCLPGGCFAELEIRDEMLKRWRPQIGGGIVKIVDAAGREIAIPFSFRGFAQALDALLKN